MDYSSSRAYTVVGLRSLRFFGFARRSRAESGRRFALSTPALVPALLTGWGFYDLTRRYGLDALTLAPSLLALAMGAAIGLAILRRAPITGGSRPASSSIGRPTTPFCR